MIPLSEESMAQNSQIIFSSAINLLMLRVFRINSSIWARKTLLLSNLQDPIRILLMRMHLINQSNYFKILLRQSKFSTGLSRKLKNKILQAISWFFHRLGHNLVLLWVNVLLRKILILEASVHSIKKITGYLPLREISNTICFSNWRTNKITRIV
jgi:hypothetical protein